MRAPGRRPRTFKWRRLPILQLPVYVLLRIAVIVVEAAGPRRARWLGRLAGRLIHLIDAKHRRVALANLERAGVGGTPERTRRLARRAFEHLGILSAEFLQMPRLIARGTLERTCRFEGIEHLEAAKGRGRGVIIVTGHLGNFEIAALAVAAAGYDLRSVSRPIENPWVETYVQRLRGVTGQRILPKRQAMRGMVQCLREGGFLVLMMDQDQRKEGIFVPFFGREASTVRSPAVLSIKFGAPIVPMFTWRTGSGRHVVIATEPVEPPEGTDREDAVRDLTARITARLEEAIRAHPDQWLWMHQRWKTRPDGTRENAAAELAGARP